MLVENLDEIGEIAFSKTTVNSSDIKRWLDEAFSLKGFLLTQRNGGPCGVISAVQAYILVHLLFKMGLCDKGGLTALDAISNDEIKNAFLEALTTILWQARETGKTVAICTESSFEPFKDCGEIDYESVTELDEVRALLLSYLDRFFQPGGVMLFVYSVILTRGIGSICKDMDDMKQCLTGKYGHCTQVGFKS